MTRFALIPSVIAAALLLSPTLASATVSVCDATSGNLVTNCGFEAGVVSSTLGGFTDALAPADWTLNVAFDQFNGFNQVVGNPINTGVNALKIGNLDADPAATISKVLTDTPGQSYSGTFFLAYSGTGDSGAHFDAQINGSSVQSVASVSAFAFTPVTFSFLGTGSDVLTLGGNTNPGDWFLDDISVVAAPVPETTSSLIFLSGLVLLGTIVRRRGANSLT